MAITPFDRTYIPLEGGIESLPGHRFFGYEPIEQAPIGALPAPLPTTFPPPTNVRSQGALGTDGDGNRWVSRTTAPAGGATTGIPWLDASLAESMKGIESKFALPDVKLKQSVSNLIDDPQATLEQAGTSIYDKFADFDPFGLDPESLTEQVTDKGLLAKGVGAGGALIDAGLISAPVARALGAEHMMDTANVMLAPDGLFETAGLDPYETGGEQWWSAALPFGQTMATEMAQDLGGAYGVHPSEMASYMGTYSPRTVSMMEESFPGYDWGGTYTPTAAADRLTPTGAGLTIDPATHGVAGWTGYGDAYTSASGRDPYATGPAPGTPAPGPAPVTSAPLSADWWASDSGDGGRSYSVSDARERSRRERSPSEKYGGRSYGR